MGIVFFFDMELELCSQFQLQIKEKHNLPTRHWKGCLVDRYLQSNELSDIEGQLFTGTSSVGDTLHLNDNLLSVLPDDAFLDVTLQAVDMDNNRLIIYPADALSAQNLRNM